MSTRENVRSKVVAQGKSESPAESFPHEIITVTIPEFRRISGIGRTKTYELISAREIDSVHVAGRHLIIVDSYRRLVDRAKKQPPGSRGGK